MKSKVKIITVFFSLNIAVIKLAPDTPLEATMLKEKGYHNILGGMCYFFLARKFSPESGAIYSLSDT